MSKLKIFITFSLISICHASLSFANSYDREYIINFAKEYVLQNTPAPNNGKIVVIPASIDSRIAIKPCNIPLTANIPENYSSRNVNVKISCDSSIPWHIFLPVKIETTIPVLVTKNKISKGSILSKDNLLIEWRDLYQVRGEVINNIEMVDGARSKRTLSAGSVITKKLICVVCKGETVTILAESDNFMIRTTGVALENATFGEQVSIKNSRSGRTIIAQVKTINEVVINL